MKKLTLLLFGLTFLFSCSKDTIFEEETEYTLEDLIFSTEESWYVGNSSQTIQYPTNENRGSTTEEYNYSISEGILMENYHFITDESIIDELISGTKYPVNMPVNIEDNEVILSPNTTYFRFNEEVESEKKQWVRVIPVEPGWALEASSTVNFRNISVPFRAIFKGKVTGKRVEITGEWVGQIADVSYKFYNYRLP